MQKKLLQVSLYHSIISRYPSGSNDIVKRELNLSSLFLLNVRRKYHRLLVSNLLYISFIVLLINMIL